MRIGERLKHWIRIGWENADAVLVMAVAAAVVVLDIADSDLSSQVVGSATLALLGVTAFILLRDRRSRAELSDLRKLARDALSDLPYDIIWQINDWELKDRSRATVRMRRRVRFTRNQESTMTHWSCGPGKVVRCEAKWRRTSKDRWIEAKPIEKLPVRNGEKLIFSLGKEHARGDTLEWCVEIDTVDRFADTHQSVTHEAKTESDFSRSVRIVWPPGEDPRNVEMILGDRPALQLAPKTRKDRAFVEETVGRLKEGEIFTVSWIW